MFLPYAYGSFQPISENVLNSCIFKPYAEK